MKPTTPRPDGSPVQGAQAAFGSAWPYLIPAVWSLIIHGRAIGFPFVGLDDALHYTGNALVTEPSAHSLTEHFLTRAIGYPMPLTSLTYIVERALHGPAPWGPHLVNVLLHAVNVALVVRLAARLGLERASAAIAGVLFAVHPLVVEPVVWVTGRKDLLGVTFALLALGSIAGLRGPAVARRWIVVFGFVTAAMLSKPTFAPLPLMVLALHAGSRAGDRLRGAVVPVALMLATNLALVAVGILVLRAQQPVGSTPLLEVLANVGGGWALSAYHLVWPVDLLPYYFRYPGDPSPLAIAAGIVALVVITYLAARKLPSGSVTRRALSIAALAYLPVCGVVGHLRWMADSYLYLPLVGISLAAASLMQDLLAVRAPKLMLVLGAAIGVVLGGLSVLQAEVWRTPDNVWRPIVERYPQSPVALSELAITLRWIGNEEEAHNRFIQLDDRFPSFEQTIAPRAEARLRNGESARAIELLRLGLRVGDRPAARTYLALVLQANTRVVPRTPDDLRRIAELVGEDFARSVDDPALIERFASELDKAGMPSLAAKARARH